MNENGFIAQYATLGHLATCITGGDLRAMARYLNDAGAIPRLSEINPVPTASVTRAAVVDLTMCPSAPERVTTLAMGVLREWKR